ncbi:hypothetical protein BBJ28_00017317 [Nothophytophthora sp. Chile5]|nr:hypothetical protein BBJ28_00017317 [Nothophytophthora sp. Chile5]
MPASVTAVSAINSKLRVFQESELHDEYYRLLDAETELKATCLLAQQKCVNAIARARRLEEIMTMKDKKIESLLHGKAIGTDRGMSGNGSAFQREMAQRDRQSHALAQKLRLKIAQQSQLLSSYEEAMQSLRSGIKTTNAMELEEERNQLYLELHRQQELLARQRLEREAQEQKMVAFAELDAINKLTITKLQQENKVVTHAKQKLEQEVEFLQSRVEQLQSNLTREQRKRTYDREFGESRGKQNESSPARSVLLAQALEEMKSLMRKESIASSQRGKLKSLMPASVTPRADKSAVPALAAAVAPPTTASPTAPTSPRRMTQSQQRSRRPQSAGPTRSSRAAPFHKASNSAVKPSHASVEQQGGGERAEDGARADRTHIHTASVAKDSEAGPVSSPPGDESEITQPKSEGDAQEATMARDVPAANQSLGPWDDPEANSKAADASKAASTEQVRQDSRSVKDDPGNSEGAIADQDGPSAASPQPGQKGSYQEDSVSFAAVGEADSNRSTVEEVVQGAVDAITIEDLAEIQRQKIAAIDSMLRLDACLDDDLESELSADLLDDAQHPMLRSNGDDDDVLCGSDNADIELVGETYQQQDSAEENIDEDRVSSALQQDFDAMYPSDFGDTDAPSLDNEQDDDDDDEDDGEMADATTKGSQ